MKLSLTTTLPYVNSDPHIGFALEIIQADIVARWYRQRGYQVFFNTGTDEHGVKVFRKAQEEGKDIQAYVDEYAAKFDQLKSALNLSYNSFIRTTDPKHVTAAQEFWRRCAANGDIYKKTYSVKYCSGCELEKTDSELVDGKCALHPSLSIELIEEENYFFRFSKYQEPLLRLYADQPSFVVPTHRLNEIRSFVERGLTDFSISRLKEKMPWGVAVPDDEAQVMYVWFDALVNYISCLGWPDETYSDWWPSIQFAGKDNLRQQAAMWQAMLMSASVAPSKQIMIHGFLTSNGQKMSKSLGNVVDPFAVVEQYGADALRYFLARHVSPFEDSDYTAVRMQEAYTADLANGLGNLVSRVTNMLEKYCDGQYIRQPLLGDATIDTIHVAVTNYRFDEALGLIWGLVDEANKLIDTHEPWKMAKSSEAGPGPAGDEMKGKLKALLNELANRVLDIADVLVAFLPSTAEKITTALQQPVKKIEPLFPRITES